jgi:hypothetical protein
MGIKQILVDDLDGRDLPADTKAQSVTFDGKKYDVYLSARNTERFIDFLTGVAPLVGSTGGGRASSGSRPKSNAAEIRAWAKSNGMTVPDRGRIPADVREAFDAKS